MHLGESPFMTFESLGLAPELLAGGPGLRLHRPHADPGTGHSTPSDRARPDGLRPDRHGQDRRVRPPHPPPAPRQPSRGSFAPSSWCRPGSWPSRSGATSASTAQSLGLRSTAVYGGVPHRAAGDDAPPRRRHPGRHPRPAQGPHLARADRLPRDPLPRPGRGRSHARHGLHRRGPGDRRADSEGAADHALLGHAGAGDPSAWRKDILRESGAGRGRSSGHAWPTGSSTSWSASTSGRRSAAARRADPRRTRCAARWSSRGPGAAPTGSPIHLKRHGHRVTSIHSDKTQSQRVAALEAFRDGEGRRSRGHRHRGAGPRRRRGSATWSTSICRATPRTTSTGSAGPLAPGDKGVAISLVTPGGSERRAFHRAAHRAFSDGPRRASGRACADEARPREPLDSSGSLERERRRSAEGLAAGLHPGRIHAGAGSQERTPGPCASWSHGRDPSRADPPRRERGPHRQQTPHRSERRRRERGPRRAPTAR